MKKIFNYILCFSALLIIFIRGQAIAQAPAEKILVKGRVTDAADKAVIIGASVIEINSDKRTITGVATDIDGNFAIKVSNTANKIQFSYIGYKTVVLPIDKQRVFNVSLESKSNLAEINVTARPTVNNGSGLPIDERDRTTASTTIQAKDLEELSATSIAATLEGRLPGVDIVASSGDPGAGMSIRIRGTSSINGVTDPLIVVDGLPYETAVPADFNFQTADEQGYASLLSIAPSDIKEITVLKDAAATAVWGARAANGVLVITTKRGAVSSPVFTYTYKGALSLQPSLFPLLNGGQYSELIPQEYLNGTPQGTPLNTLTAKEFARDPSDPYYYYNYGQNTDWVKAISRNGYTHDNNLSITGGGEKARYFASLGYVTQTGTTLGTSLQRLNARLNLDYMVSDRLRFRTDIAYTHSITDGNYVNQAVGKNSDDSNIRNIAFNKMPNMSIYEYDEYGHMTPNFFTPSSNIQGQYPETFNPVAMAMYGINNLKSDRITPHFNLQYQITPGKLILTSDVQFDVNTAVRNSFLPQSATGRPTTETAVNRAYNYDVDGYDVQSKTNLVYTPQIADKVTFSGLLSIQTDDNKGLSQSLLTANTASSYLQDPSDPSRSQNSDLGVAATATEVRKLAALVSGQFSFFDRYIINVGLRGDANSNFGPDHRYGLFPSVSGRYRLSGEPFMKRFKFLNDLSLRASYGIIGNAPSTPYTFYNQFSNFNWTYLGQSAVYSSNIELTNLRYEKVKGQNLGFNLSLFNSRVNFDGEIYRNRTSDLFFTPTIANFNGYTSLNLNVGTMDNQGFEVSFNVTPVKKKDLIVDFTFNIAHNENVIREISPLVNTSNGGGTTNGTFLSLLQVNNPLGSFYGYIFDGVYKDQNATIATDRDGKQILGPDKKPVYMRYNYPAVDYTFQPGDAKYRDVNNDGVIDSRDIVYLGNGNPRFTGGFGPTVTYKRNWKFSAFFSYRYKFDLINNTMVTTTNEYKYNNQSTAVLRRWQKPGDVTDIPRAAFNTGYNWLGSSRYVQDGSYLRFSAATIRYNLETLFAKKLSLKSASIYFSGQNLYTFTHYLGQDPEVSAKSSDIYKQPIDNSNTPASITYTLGLTASF
ncbi:SusC/RagA family TonB-linked outer membrane protein [Mucilaginibacter sp. HMF5004]|uniref:SusC/RagA family TonB-linked outer membrane protein n=1 Tax=Mucilaginibacter rivuli TaxID=2857527 RepID=UPI001C5D31AE|nr:SusC/RagA family TonB-linked outer membrane protein [Mucilaginibacter rivuli]MBW4888978.1 SusC/RagA family TonB-linked outer membrane protein [Mucilaginibacter rivuli]